LLLELPSFSREQVFDLAQRYEVHRADLSDLAELEPLFVLIDGHPYLWHLALYWLRSGLLALPQLLKQAPTNQGIYQEHLRSIGIKLQRDPALVTAMQEMLATAEPIYLAQSTLDQLHELGLVRSEGMQATLSCDLYRQYFAPRLVEQRV
jgi:hypothetical protein